MTTFYVDVSHHDRDRKGGPLDWHQIFAATSPVMVAKLSEGDQATVGSLDSYGVQAIQDALAAGGQMCGGYHVPRHGDLASIWRQVDVLRRKLDQAGGNWAMLDSEPFQELGDNWPRFIDIQHFDDRWASLEQRVLGHYLPRWFWEQPRFAKPWLQSLRGPLVASGYHTNAALSPATLYAHDGGDSNANWASYGGRTPNILQFGSDCRIPGASSGSDINAFRGSLTELITLLQGDADMPLPKADLTAIATEVWYRDIGRAPGAQPAWTTLGDLAAAVPGDLTARLDALLKAVTEPQPAVINAIVTGVLTGLDTSVLEGLDVAALAEAISAKVITQVSALKFGVAS